MGGGTISNVGGAQVHVKKLWKIVVVLIESCDVTIIENDVINFVSMFKQCFISPQLPLSTLHLRYADLST